MKQGKVTIEDLAQLIAGTTKGVRPVRPPLRLVGAPKPQLFDSITRASITARIRTLQRMYHLQWLVEQATFNTPGIDSLEDADLSELLRQAERARECLAEGIGFDEAGLVRNTANRLPSTYGSKD